MRAMITAFANLGVVRYAAEKAKIGPGAHYDWYRTYPEYRELFDEAEKMAADQLEKAARDRAVHGIDRPVFQGGALVGKERVYSDNLLMFMLKGVRPEKFREGVSVRLTGPGDGPVQVEQYGIDLKDRANLDRLTELLRARAPIAKSGEQGKDPAGCAGKQA